MTQNELKPYMGRFADLCDVLESTLRLMPHNTPELCVLEHINAQLRDLVRDLDHIGVMP